jgi:hypothetical protein
MADLQFYNDLREPFCVADLAAVTLSTTNKALYPAGSFPNLGGQYWARPGKKQRITMFGKITTDGTAGNGQFVVYYGTGGDANGTILVSQTAVAISTSQTNISWMAEFYIRCTATGASGALEVVGWCMFNEAALVAHQLIPASAAAAVTVDLTAANIISVQYNRSGAGVWTMTTQDLSVVAVN